MKILLGVALICLGGTVRYWAPGSEYGNLGLTEPEALLPGDEVTLTIWRENKPTYSFFGELSYEAQPITVKDEQALVWFEEVIDTNNPKIHDVGYLVRKPGGVVNLEHDVWVKFRLPNDARLANNTLRLRVFNEPVPYVSASIDKEFELVVTTRLGRGLFTAFKYAVVLGYCTAVLGLFFVLNVLEIW